MKTADALLATLKKHNPARVRVYNGDDDTRDVAVPTRRKKWDQVVRAIDGKAWSRCELLDKSGAVLGYVDNEGPAREVEDIGPSFEGVRGQLLLGERIAALCMNSVRTAVAQRDEETRALLTAQREVVTASVQSVREMAAAVQSLGEVYRENVVAAEEAAQARATAEAAAAAGGGQLKELMEALPVIMQAMPALRAMLGAGDAATPPNGARKS